MANFGGKISQGSLEIQVDDINLLDSSKLGNLRLGRTCQHPLCHWPQHSLGPAGADQLLAPRQQMWGETRGFKPLGEWLCFFNYSQSYIIGNLSVKEHAALMGTNAYAFCRLKTGLFFLGAGIGEVSHTAVPFAVLRGSFCCKSCKRAWEGYSSKRD